MGLQRHGGKLSGWSFRGAISDSVAEIYFQYVSIAIIAIMISHAPTSIPLRRLLIHYARLNATSPAIYI
jgi:hypothetical protein